MSSAASTSGSSWPPSLKGFVARALSSATASNKSAVNDELRKMIFASHREGSLHTKDWEGMDPNKELDTLRQQAIRSAAAAAAPLFPPPPPPPSIPLNMGLPMSFGSARPGIGIADSHAHLQKSKKGIQVKESAYLEPALNGKRKKPEATPSKNTKKQKQATTTFPSAFALPTPQEDEARARRAQRFAREKELEDRKEASGPMFTPRQLPGHNTAGALAVTDNVAGDGVVKLSQMGVKGAKEPSSPSKGGGRRNWLGARLGMEEVEPDSNVIDWDRYTIVGTNMKLEKRYLRLTSEPNPADIRPLPVLKQTLELLKQRWKESQDYAYICDQFKSLRQDLTVQRIKNEFTVSVYEIHARMALEAKDLGEYNQCQSMLRQLYELNIAGHPDEFMAYRILYMLHTRNTAELGRIIGHLAPGEKKAPAVKHALDVATAIATGNYHRFFLLFVEAPNMGGYIMDHFVERERIIALTKMSKAYVTLPLTFITSVLAFDSIHQAAKFLTDHDAAAWHAPAAPGAFPDLKTAHALHSKAGKRPKKPSEPPLEERVWDCKAAHAACEKGIQRYKTVDLKGQI